jgi:hypothetical protein
MVRLTLAETGEENELWGRNLKMWYFTLWYFTFSF